jgi:hypothetical protein
LEAVTDKLKAWFEADPGVTGRQLLDRLQVAHPDIYPDGLIRSVQRRLNIWRRESARALVLGGIDTFSANGRLSGEALRWLRAPHPAGKPPTPTDAPVEIVPVVAPEPKGLGNIPDEATAITSGTFLHEAIRLLTQIVAPHWSHRLDWTRGALFSKAC